MMVIIAWITVDRFRQDETREVFLPSWDHEISKSEIFISLCPDYRNSAQLKRTNENWILSTLFSLSPNLVMKNEIWACTQS